MARIWKKSEYSKAAKELKRFGYDITYRANDRKTFRQRGIIRQLYESKVSYIRATEKTRLVRVGDENQDYTFKFQRLTPKEKKMAIESGLFSREQFTKRGLFLEKPINLRSSQYKVKFTKRGVTIKGLSRSDRIVRLDAKTLAVDPEKAVKQAVLGEPKRISLMVNGFRSQHESLSLKQFWQYMRDELLPQWMDKNDHYPNPEKLFTDIFHLRLLYK